MGKIALWIVVIIVVMLLVRALKPRRGADAGGGDKGAAKGGAKGGGSGGRDGDRPAQGDGPRGELMMSCAVCGVHLPASDAVFARGRVYCGPEHRDVDLDGQPRDRDAAARGNRE
jgi:uncharacterized protein